MLLTEEQQMIREMTRRFVEENIAPHAAEWDRDHIFPKETIKALGELGLMGMTIPEKWGGAEAGYVALALAIEEIAIGDGACSTIVSVNNSVACMPIYTFGNDQQKEVFLKPLASGEKLGAFCLTEPHTGSDASAISTKAKVVGDSFILNGVKQFITSGQNADFAIVFAVTDASAGNKGISAFIVPTTAEGYIVSKIEDKLGQNASDTAQITLENCQIPKENLLGQLGEGYKIALSNLEGGRIGVAAQSVGMAQAALDATLTYVQDRTAFGKKLAEQQAVAFQLADMATQITAARELYLAAAQRKESGLSCLQEASMAKLFASEMAEKVCSQAIQLHGGYGYVKDFPVERYYRDVRVSQIYEGTSEIQRLVISRSLLAG